MCNTDVSNVTDVTGCETFWVVLHCGFIAYALWVSDSYKGAYFDSFLEPEMFKQLPAFTWGLIISNDITGKKSFSLFNFKQSSFIIITVGLKEQVGLSSQYHVSNKYEVSPVSVVVSIFYAIFTLHLSRNMCVLFSA